MICAIIKAMGKEVKVTASEPLTADKGVRIGKTMGKSDGPTLIPIDEDLSGAKKKTVNKTTASKANRKISVKSTDGVSKREAEKISDAADALVMDDVKPVKKSAKNNAKVPAKGAKAGAKTLVMDSMVRQKAKAAVAPKNDASTKEDSLSSNAKKFVDDKKDDDEAKVQGGVKRTKQSSKSKATIIAIVTAILVGAAGMLLMFLLNRQSEKMCVLQFEVNGGSKIESQEVVCGTKATRPDDPEKEGFEFQDWLMDGMPFDFEGETIDKDMTVIAKWLVGADTEVVRITFDSAGGSEVAEREAVKGKATTAPLDPTRDGYTFDGWYLDGEKFDFETPIDEDITLVAGWKDNNSGTVTRPQGNGNSGSTTDKPELQRLSVGQNITMEAGSRDSFSISVLPVSAEADLEVNSDNKSVVNCEKEGSGRSMSCMAGNAGEATITIRDKISGKTVTTKITVKEKDGGGTGGGSTTPTPIPVASIVLSGYVVNLDAVGATATITATVLPEDADDKTVVWTSSDGSVATVSGGKITAVGAGTATITVTAGGKSATVTVTVTAASGAEDTPTE